MNTRKVLVILIVFLLIAALGLGVWNLFLKTPDSSNTEKKGGELPQSATSTREPAGTTSSKATGTETILPEPKKESGTEEASPDSDSGDSASEDSNEAKEKKIKQLTKVEILGPKITKTDNFVKYYQKKDGRVFKVSFNGQTKEKISDTKITGLEDVNWSPEGNQIITTWIKENRLHKTHYSYKTKKATDLDSRLKKINWAPNGEQIFYHFINKRGESNLALSEPDNSNWKSIEPMSIEETKLYWPRLDFVSTVTPGTEFYPATVYRLPLDSDEEEKVLEGVDLESGLRWSHGGGMFLFKRDSDDPLKLYRLGEGSDNLKITAPVSKCSWAKNDKSIYCVMPTQEIIDEDLLPESYAEEFLPQSDSFWQIDLEEKKVRELYIPKSSQNVINVKKETLRVGPEENYLFWVDGGTNRLYRLKL